MPSGLDRANELSRLALLSELSETLAGSLSLRGSLARVLEVLGDELGAVGSLAAVYAEGGLLRVEAASGLVGTASGTFRKGQGISGRVAASGKPITVPEVGREPLMREEPGAPAKVRRGRDLTLIAVPIKLDGRPEGVLSVLLPFERRRDYERQVALLSLIASLAAQALRVDRLVETERSRLLTENRQLKQELRDRYDLPNLVGTSRPMQLVYEQVGQAAPTDTTVLLRGESGTGKELVAHAIHYGSPRADRPFVKVSGAALPETLVEAELFGYEPGAFTDARSQKKGRFELADGGTLFLDEVGELSPAMQVKLLRVLQEREFERLGGVAPIKVDVRLIAATNKDLEAAIRAGTFREDLYYRLNVFSIFLPPLRERKPDILLLADHFVEAFARRHGRDVKRISTSAIDMLTSYHWPGNVRELQNCLERAVLVCEGGALHGHHLPPTLQTAEVSGTLPRQSLSASVAAHEKDLILDALKIARGNRAKAARLLETTERILAYKARKLGIDAGRFRPARA